MYTHTQAVTNLPAMQETWFQSLGGEHPWRGEWLPTPVFWPGELHELYRPWGHKELDTTEQLSLSYMHKIKSLRSYTGYEEYLVLWNKAFFLGFLTSWNIQQS